MIIRSSSRRWLPFVGAAVVLTLALAACGDDTPTASTSETPVTTTAETAPEGNESTTVGPDLEDAVAAVGTRYAFSASITLDGVEVTRVTGTVYDGTGAYLVEAGGADIEYVVSDQGQWAREPGEEWALLAGAAPLADPLEPLGAPSTFTVLESNGSNALLEAVYDGASLGFASGGEVTVTVTVTDGAVASISYDAMVGDDLATVVTRFDGTADVAPIQVPPA